MQLVTFTSGAAPQPGAVVDETMIVPLSMIAPDMLTLIAHWDTLRSAVEAAAEARAGALDLASVRLLAPVPRPGPQRASRQVCLPGGLIRPSSSKHTYQPGVKGKYACRGG